MANFEAFLWTINLTSHPEFLKSVRAFIHRYLFIEVQAADYNCIVGKKIFEEWQLFL